MNITELKALAEKATPGPWIAGDDEDSDYFLVGPCGDDGIVYQSVVKLHSETHADYIAAANPAAILELITQLEDAQGEIRALRATEAGLRERVKELQFGLSEVEKLMDESHGVAGLHLNGDVAPWSELRSGGRFETWLLGFDEALALLEKKE